MYLESRPSARAVYMHVGFVPQGDYSFLRRVPKVVRGLKAEGMEDGKAEQKVDKVDVEDAAKAAEGSFAHWVDHDGARLDVQTAAMLCGLRVELDIEMRHRVIDCAKRGCDGAGEHDEVQSRRRSCQVSFVDISLLEYLGSFRALLQCSRRNM
jgi:hypothetical protein